MVSRAVRLSVFLVTLVCVAQSRKAATSPSTPGPPLRLERTLSLPGIDGRLGRPAVDVAGRRLFVPALAADVVVVLDLQTGKVVQTIGGLKRPQAIAWNADAKKLFVSTREDAGLSIYNGQTLTLAKRVQLGVVPDEIRFAPRGKQVYVAAGNTVAILDLNGQALGNIRLDSQADALLVDPANSRLWINLPFAKAIGVADVTGRVLRRNLPATTGTSTGATNAFALDERGRRLLLATRRPSKLLAMNYDSGVIVDERQTINDPEDISFDPSTRRLFVTGNDSFIDVVQQVDPDHYEPLQRVQSVPSARASVLSPELGRLFVAASRSAPKDAAVLVFEPVK